MGLHPDDQDIWDDEWRKVRDDLPRIIAPRRRPRTLVHFIDGPMAGITYVVKQRFEHGYVWLIDCAMEDGTVHRYQTHVAPTSEGELGAVYAGRVR